MNPRETIQEFLFRLVDKSRMEVREYTRTDARNDAEKLMEELQFPDVVIDERALMRICETGARAIREEAGQVQRPRVIIEALSDYLRSKGVRPNFVVRR